MLPHADNQQYFIQNAFSSFQLSISTTSTEKYLRSYPKFQTIIVRVTGLIDIIILIGQYVVYLFTPGDYYVDTIAYYDNGCNNGINNMSNNNSHLKSHQIKIKSLFSPKNADDLKRTIKKTKKEIKVTYSDSFKWQIMPKLNAKTKYALLCKSKAAEILSVDYLIGKISRIDKMIQSLNQDNLQYCFNNSIGSNNNWNFANKSVQEGNDNNQHSKVLILNSIYSST